MVWRRWHDGKFFSTGETVKEAHSQPQAHRTSFISSSLTLFRAAEPSLTVKLLADRHEINPPDLCSNIPHFYKGNYQKAWDSTRQHTGWHVIKSAAVLMSCSATQLQHKCAATKSSYGLQNVAWERERMNWSCNFFLSFFLFGLKCNERSGIWLSMNKVFHSAFFSLVFPFSCCVVSFARRRRREMDINQSDILDVHSSMYTWATGTTHRCSNLAGLFLQEDIFTDIWARKLQSCDTLYSLGYFLLFRRTIKPKKLPDMLWKNKMLNHYKFK